MSSPLSANELADRYPDEEFRFKLRRLVRIRVFMEKSIIGPGYRVPADLHQSIRLTPYGERFFGVLTRKQVPYPEARLLCFLELWNIDLLVDPIETDADALTEAISQEVKGGKFRYPFTYGRVLYDHVADQDARPSRAYLPEKETWRLLSDTPQGVVQVGNLVAGPFGLLEGSEQRSLEPDRTARYHCGDPSCNEVHQYWLFSSTEAVINKEREKLTKEFERESAQQSSFTEFLANTNRRAGKFIYDDQNGDAIPILVGDALDDTEKRALLAWLLDNTGGVLRAKARAVGLSGKAADICKKLGPAELMQIIMLAQNKEISAGLDSLVMAGTIMVPEGETRTTVLNNFKVGPYRLYGELNRYGVRIASQRQHIAPLRLRRLVSQMYQLDDESDRQELDWQLRDETGEKLEGKIDQFLKRQTPRDVVSTLLLTRRSNIVVASEKLRFSLDLLSEDVQRVNATLWKLGYATDDSIDPHARFWRFHEVLYQACRQASLSPVSADMEKLRERSVNYFITLEEILRDSLLYTTWALTSDHHADDHGFFYRPHIDASAALTTLKIFAAHDTSDHALVLDDPISLYALTRGFGLLASHLSDLLEKRDDHKRPDDSLPEWVGMQDLQLFPFWHDLLFLDLAEQSREKVLSDLQEISRSLTAAGVSDVRNSLLHPRTADLQKLSIALEAIESAVRTIQRSGYSRQAFKVAKQVIDEDGKATITLSNPHGETALLHHPSHFSWLTLPGPHDGHGALHFMSTAFTGNPLEAMRFVTRQDSAYSKMWDNYPRRPDPDSGSSDLAFKMAGTGIAAGIE